MTLLEQTFSVRFSIVDGRTGDVLETAWDQPSRDWGRAAELCRETSRRARPELIDDDDPLVTLAVPLPGGGADSLVAVAAFVTRPVERIEDVARAAETLGMQPADVLAWAREQTPWAAETLLRIAELAVDGAQAGRLAAKMQKEADALSVHLATTYEEISLLHRLMQNLRLSKSDEELGREALEWMLEVVPASGLALQLVPAPGAAKSLTRTARMEPMLLSRGECPLDNEQFSALITHLGARPTHRPLVLNRAITDRADWPFPQIREMIAVALADGETVFGWLAALNHAQAEEFGTVEANLLSSVAAILGIHGSNIELYRQQSELLAGVVRALTSAIDAKDPYTCGHSDRVARIAVRLADELGCDAKMLSTLYLAGMLHDIGKIGVNDSVLRKEGRLSTEEYEHIKGHVSIGHRILCDLAKLEDVLPVVLHHHESWNGGGYPNRLASDQIPLSARIVAVADAFDAMSSDRPYRKGMPDEKVDDILRSGAGQQWDPDVIDAFFRARDDIRRMQREEMKEG